MDLVVETRVPLACINVRGDAEDPRFLRAVASVADLAPPIAPNTTVTGLLASLLWMSPNEWLIVSDAQSGAQLTARLAQALGGLNAAATDVTDARRVFRVSGPSAYDVLARGCALDFYPSAFPVGRCAQTLVAKIAALAHLRAPEPVFDVYVARSFSGYAWRWFEVATRIYRDSA